MEKICGNCHYYANSPLHGPWCTKNRKEVSYLQSAFDCWTEPGTAPAEEIQMKVCSHCGRELPITNFGRHSRTKDGYQPCCRECLSKMNKGHKKRQPAEHNEAPKKAPEYTPEQMGIGKGRRADHPTYIDKDTGVTMKWCKGCKQYKPIDEFHHNKANKDGHEFDCKVQGLPQLPCVRSARPQKGREEGGEGEGKTQRRPEGGNTDRERPGRAAKTPHHPQGGHR